MSLNILMYNVKHRNVFHYIAVLQCILILLTRHWKCSQFLAITTGYLYNKTRSAWKVDVLNSRDSGTDQALRRVVSGCASWQPELPRFSPCLKFGAQPLAILVPTPFQSILTVQLAKVSFCCLKLKHLLIYKIPFSSTIFHYSGTNDTQPTNLTTGHVPGSSQ